ncbi:MAG TPA: hypothetical protein VJM82_06965, partial [Nitrospiraceae bacterium]|nr:hypothetical protein [Nitrospiraceae bacterium]
MPVQEQFGGIPSMRERSLTRVIGRIDRLLVRGAASSATFTRWRFIIFVTGLLCTITLYKMARYQSGNGSLIAFVSLFVVVASYHN